MKATLSFNLPEEEDEFEVASKAQHLRSILSEFDNYLRSKVKYGESLTDDQRDTYQAVRTRLYEMMAGMDLGGLL